MARPTTPRRHLAAFAFTLATVAVAAAPHVARAQGAALTCDSPGGTDLGRVTLTTSTTWTRPGSPYRLADTVTMSGAGVTLTLEPGALVCAAPVAALRVRGGARLIARGTSTDPIVFTTAHAVASWSGLSLADAASDTSVLVNALVERSRWGVRADAAHRVVLDSVRIRQSDSSGVSLWGARSRISRSTIDTTSTARYAAVTVGDSATFEETVVRGAAGTGILLAGVQGGRRLLGGRVEGSGGIGIVGTDSARSEDRTRIREARPIGVTGGASYAVRLGLGDFACLYPTAQSLDGLYDNAVDTVVIRGGRLDGCQLRLTIDERAPLRIEGTLTVPAGAQLDLRPGARLAFDQQAEIDLFHGRLMAQGSGEWPVHLAAVDSARPSGAIRFRGAPPDTSRMTNVIAQTPFWIEGVDQTHKLAIDSVYMYGGTVSLNGNGSRISRSLIESATVRLGPYTMLEETIVRRSKGWNPIAWGVLTATGVRIRRCEITGGDGYGIYVSVYDSHDISIRDCNLEGNALDGVWAHPNVRNVVDARWNWWGDPAGPKGANGDGVGPDHILYDNWLTSRVDIRASNPVEVAQVVIAADSVRLPTAGASTQLAAEIYEGARPLAGTMAWISRDTRVATVTATGLVTAIGDGATRVVATPVLGLADSAKVVVGRDVIEAGCAAPGGTTYGATTLTASTTWTRDGSPYRLTGTLTVSGSTLSIQPGTLVCAASGTYLVARSGGWIDARGNAADPVVITASDTARGWAGIHLQGTPPGRSTLSNVVLLHTGTAAGGVNGIPAVATYENHSVVIDSTVIRHGRGAAAHLGGSSRISRSLVDSLRPGGAEAILLRDFAIFEDTRVHAREVGIRLGGIGAVRLLGGSIVGSTSAGILDDSPRPRLLEARPVRVITAAGYAVSLSVKDFLLLYPTLEDQDSLRRGGATRDTIVLDRGELITRELTFGPSFHYLVQGEVLMRAYSTVRLLPGAHVSFGPAGSLELQFSRLVARGTPSDPIRLSGGGNEPIVVYGGTPLDTSFLTNVVVEDVPHGIQAGNGALLVIDSARFHRTGPAVSLGRDSRISRSSIDSMTTPGSTNCALATGDGTLVEDMVLRGVKYGVCLHGTNVRLQGVTIRDFHLGIWGDTGVDHLAEARRVRVTRAYTTTSGSCIAAVALSITDFATLAPTPVEQDSLTGATCSWATFRGGRLSGRALTLGPALTYFDGGTARLGASATRVGTGATLTILPGVEIRSANGAGLVVEPGGTLLARGTAAAPIRFLHDGRYASDGWDGGYMWAGLTFAGAQGDTAVLEHVLLENARWGVRAEGPHVLHADYARFRRITNTAAILGAAGSSLLDSAIDTTLTTTSPAVVLGGGTRLEGTTVRGAAGAGVQVTGADVTLRRCEVTGSGGDGVSFDASAGGSVQDCNLVDNAGVGVRNAAPASVDARWNWWGDAAGPLGPAGDGVAGNVLYDPWHTRRVDIHDPPPHAVTWAVVTPDSVRLTSAGDTARLAAQLYEGTTPAVGSIDWTTRDVTVATVDATGLVTAVADGVTWVLATPPAPGLADSALVRVVIPPRPPLVVAILTPSRDTTVTLGDSLWLSARTEDPADSLTLAWRLSDGRTFAGATPGWVRFTAALADTIVATATRDAQQATAMRVVTVTMPNALPVVAFVAPAADTTAIAPDSILFRVEARDGDGAIAEYRWDFGDGRTATGASLDSLWRAYASPGRYAVTVRVVDDSGAVSEPAVRGVDVAPNLAPLATIVGLRDTTIALGDSLRLAGEGSDPDGIVSAYEWRLDDGRTFAQREPGWVTFARVDTVLVQLWVTDDRGLRSLAPAAVTVTVLRPNVRPVATILAPRADTTVVAGDSILVDGGATDDDGAIVVWAWRLDDTRTSATGRPGWVTYPAAGRFALALAVTDDSGAVSLPDTVWITVRANAVPTVAIIAPAADTTIYVGDSVRVTAAASDADGDATTVEWTSASGAAVGETATGAGPHWLHFRRAGTYLVTAVARDWRGGVSSGATRTVEVRARGVNVVVTSGQSRDRVDGRDLVFVIRAMRTQDLRADVNGDGVVNATDLALVRAAFGRSPARAASRSVP